MIPFVCTVLIPMSAAASMTPMGLRIDDSCEIQWGQFKGETDRWAMWKGAGAEAEMSLGAAKEILKSSLELGKEYRDCVGQHEEERSSPNQDSCVSKLPRGTETDELAPALHSIGALGTSSDASLLEDFRSRYWARNREYAAFLAEMAWKHIMLDRLSSPEIIDWMSANWNSARRTLELRNNLCEIEFQELHCKLGWTSTLLSLFRSTNPVVRHWVAGLSVEGGNRMSWPLEVIPSILRLAVDDSEEVRGPIVSSLDRIALDGVTWLPVLAKIVYDDRIPDSRRQALLDALKNNPGGAIGCSAGRCFRSSVGDGGSR